MVRDGRCYEYNDLSYGTWEIPEEDFGMKPFNLKGQNKNSEFQ